MFESQRSLINEIKKIGEYNNFSSINKNKNKNFIKQLNSVKEILFAIYNETKKLIELFHSYLTESQKYRLEKDIEDNIKFYKTNNHDNIYEEYIFLNKKINSNNFMN